MHLLCALLQTLPAPAATRTSGAENSPVLCAKLWVHQGTLRKHSATLPGPSMATGDGVHTPSVWGDPGGPTLGHRPRWHLNPRGPLGSAWAPQDHSVQTSSGAPLGATFCDSNCSFLCPLF